RKLQYRYAGLSSCEFPACRLVQASEPVAGIIMIDISAVLDCSGAIDNPSCLIEFKRHLCQAVEIAVWMRAHHERNLWFRKSNFNCRLHRARSASRSVADFTFLSRFTRQLGLLSFAKVLFFAASTVGWSAVIARRSRLVRHSPPPEARRFSSLQALRACG